MNIEYVLSFELDIFAAQYYVRAVPSGSMVLNYYHCIYGAAHVLPDCILWEVFGRPERKHYPYRIDYVETRKDYYISDNNHTVYVIDTNGCINSVTVYDAMLHVRLHWIHHKEDGLYSVPANTTSYNTVNMLYNRLRHLF